MCNCSRTKPEKNQGYSNLIKHLTAQHRDYGTIYAREKNEAAGKVGGIMKYLKKQASAKAENIWAWIDWVVGDNLPFEFVESPRARANSKLEAIRINSLKKYMKALMLKVEGKLEELLKAHKTFGLITDGWTIDSDHYMTLFATFVDRSS
jgi:hypothetical protein